MTPAARAAAIVAAAEALLGVGFRLQGRSPEHGLDCVGVAALAARAGGFGRDIPGDYALRGGDAEAIVARFDASGLARVAEPLPGDIALFAAGPAQFHLAVLVPGRIVHADALLRRVLQRPGMPPWPMLGRWRVTGD
ncbi:peptidoglycan endopeptidase [Sphingomonas sp. UYP23]